MDDMTAFEHQVVGQIHRWVGPPRPVDDAAIFAAITTTPSPRWRFQSMFRATRFVVAGVTVALFGGFLLAGVLPQPNGEMTPGVDVASPEASASASPSSTIGLVTEEVKHGVHRVLDDGAGHDLTSTAASDAPREVAVGDDGSVWLHVGTETEGRLFRLGDAADHAMPSWPTRARITAAPDGSVWMLGGPVDEGHGHGLRALLDGEWTEFAAPPGVTVPDLGIAGDGSVWALWNVRAIRPTSANDLFADPQSGVSVARLVDGEWQETTVDIASHAGDGGRMAVGPDGSLLVGIGFAHNGRPDGAWGGLAEADGERWVAAITDPDGDGVSHVATGRDGTTWAYMHQSGYEGPRLHRRIDDEWETFGDDGSVPWLEGTQVYGSEIAVDDYGKLWVAYGGGFWDGDPSDAASRRGEEGDGVCGLLSFDGEVWAHHLVDQCPSDISAGPGGTVWEVVSGGSVPGDDWLPAAPKRTLGVYVFTSEAVGAASDCPGIPDPRVRGCQLSDVIAPRPWRPRSGRVAAIGMRSTDVVGGREREGHRLAREGHVGTAVELAWPLLGPREALPRDRDDVADPHLEGVHVGARQQRCRKILRWGPERNGAGPGPPVPSPLPASAAMSVSGVR